MLFKNQLIHKLNHKKVNRVFERHRGKNVFYKLDQSDRYYFSFCAILGDIIEHCFFIKIRAQINID